MLNTFKKQTYAKQLTKGNKKIWIWYYIRADMGLFPVHIAVVTPKEQYSYSGYIWKYRIILMSEIKYIKKVLHIVHSNNYHLLCSNAYCIFIQ